MSTRTRTRKVHPLPLYFAECRFGRAGHAFRETDRDQNSRDQIIALMRSGEIEAFHIIEVIEPCEDFPMGRVADVTFELQAEASLMEAA